MSFHFTRRLKILGFAALIAGAVAAAPKSAEAAPPSRVQYRQGQWYVIRGQRLQYRNGAWYNSQGVRRSDLDRDGIPNKFDRDRDGDGRRNANDKRPNTPARGVQYRPGQWYTIRGQRLQYRNGAWYNSQGVRRSDLDRDGVPNKFDRDRDGDGRRNSNDKHPNNPVKGGIDLDRDGIRNGKDRDRDGDGRRNSNDKHPNNPLRGSKDIDRDGIRNKKDRDRDGDGRRNSQDKSPSNRRKR